jgi:predicted glycoside hydrolase/deacetylase ChbG (UPF0249 family)
MFLRDGKKITISADDFGISRWANENIFQLIEQKKIDRVEIMIGEKNITPEHVAKLIASGIKLNIHLHLSKDKLPFWQNNRRKLETGTLKRTFLFLFGYFFGENRPQKVAKEWESQIQQFQKLFGKNPDGVSSHEHIHFFPSYFRATLKLSLKNNIPYVRLGKYWAKEKNKICLILNSLRKIDYIFFKKFGLASSDFLISYDWLTDFDEFLKNYPADKQIEVIFHPEKDNEFKFLSGTH